MKITINGKGNMEVELDTDTLTAEQREQIIAALAEKPKGFPRVGGRYECLTSADWSTDEWRNSHLDVARLACGNVHPVGRGEYLHRRRIAVKAMWDYVEREMPFVPDWNKPHQYKHFPVYNHYQARWWMSYDTGSQYQFKFPYVAEKDAERFLSENADNLAVIAEGVDKWGM